MISYQAVAFCQTQRFSSGGADVAVFVIDMRVCEEEDLFCCETYFNFSGSVVTCEKVVL